VKLREGKSINSRGQALFILRGHIALSMVSIGVIIQHTLTEVEFPTGRCWIDKATEEGQVIYFP
jgi:hypothetical protein